MNKYYEYIRWSNESAHHPSQDYSFTIPDTIDKDTSFEIKYANRAVWANPFVNSENSCFWGPISSYGILTVNYFSDSAQSNVSTGGVIKYDKNKYYFDGLLIKTCAEASTSTTGIIINKSVYGDSANAMDIYYIKVWQNNVLTRDLVPCLNDSNEKGFYDRVSGTFFKDLKGTATLYNEQYLINVSSSGNGTASGGGLVSSGASVTVTATPDEGYQFLNWTSNGSVVSTNNPYTFTANADIDLVANFTNTSSCKFKVNGEWVDASMFIKVNGEWKEGEIKIKDGTWKGAI